MALCRNTREGPCRQHWAWSPNTSITSPQGAPERVRAGQGKGASNTGRPSRNFRAVRNAAEGRLRPSLEPVAGVRHGASSEQVLRPCVAARFDRLENGLVPLVGQQALHVRCACQLAQDVRGARHSVVCDEQLLSATGHKGERVLLEESSDQVLRQHAGPNKSRPRNHLGLSHA
jgi:hypothetical protein